MMNCTCRLKAKQNESYIISYSHASTEFLLVFLHSFFLFSIWLLYAHRCVFVCAVLFWGCSKGCVLCVFRRAVNPFLVTPNSQKPKTVEAPTRQIKPLAPKQKMKTSKRSLDLNPAPAMPVVRQFAFIYFLWHFCLILTSSFSCQNCVCLKWTPPGVYLFFVQSMMKRSPVVKVKAPEEEEDMGNIEQVESQVDQLGGAKQVDDING